MRNQYIILSLLLAGAYILSQASTAQLLTRGQAMPTNTLIQQQRQTAEALQARRITGQVTDENNQGLPGANVVEKGTATGTSTDATGNFVLNVSDEATTLTVSSVGYVPQDVAIGSGSTVTVKLVPDNRTLSEVVVIGYQTIRKRDVTGANDVVNADEAGRVTANSLAESIQGLSPGVTVRNTGVPGQQSSIQIRGWPVF